MAQKFIVAANWKLHKSPHEVRDFFDSFLKLAQQQLVPAISTQNEIHMGETTKDETAKDETDRGGKTSNPKNPSTKVSPLAQRETPLECIFFPQALSADATHNCLTQADIVNAGSKLATSRVSVSSRATSRLGASDAVHFDLSVPELKGGHLSLAWGGQNVATDAQGAFTGENSAQVLKAMGACYVLVGHSERRQLFGETEEQVEKKLHLAWQHKLTPLLCVGETLQQRKNQQTEQILTEQLKVLKNLDFAKPSAAQHDTAIKTGTTDTAKTTAAQKSKPAGLTQGQQVPSLIVAYEPVWAIGTGQRAKLEDVARVRQFLHDHLPAGVPVLYGGSVKASHAKELSKVVDGFLVGSASLDPQEFIKIANHAKRVDKQMGQKA